MSETSPYSTQLQGLTSYGLLCGQGPMNRLDNPTLYPPHYSQMTLKTQK